MLINETILSALPRQKQPNPTEAAASRDEAVGILPRAGPRSRGRAGRQREDLEESGRRVRVPGLACDRTSITLVFAAEAPVAEARTRTEIHQMFIPLPYGGRGGWAP